MVRLSLLLAVLLLVSAPEVSATYGYAEWAEELGIDMNASYSGRRVMESRHGTMEFIERRSPQKTYMEFEQQGVKGGVIIREDLDKAYVLMFPMNMYRETDISEAMRQSAGDTQVSDVARVGREQVNGLDATKYRARFSDSNGSGEGFIWVSDDGVPVRMDMTYDSGGKGERLNMVLHDLKMETQPDSAFELPKDMRPMNFGGLRIPGLGGGQPSAGDEADGEGGADQLRKALEEMRKRMGQ